MGKATTTTAPPARRQTRSAGLPTLQITNLPRLPPAPPSPPSKRRSPALPPKLGIKKRKPRPNSVVTAANQRARAAPSPYPPRKPPRAASPRRSQPRLSARFSNIQTETEVKRKGLRHFAVRVSRKVEEKVVTTYNEVADELVAEETQLKQEELESGGPGASALQKKMEKNGTLVDEKNIRRRVYDSLNVLMAMGIIEKEKKLITWQGLAMAQCARGNAEIAAVKAAISEKKRVLEEKRRFLNSVQDQHNRTFQIVERNKEAARIPGVVQDLFDGSDNLLPVHHHYTDRLGLPFVIISAPQETSIELEMDKSREDICFTFSSAFQIFDEREILKRMNLLQPGLPSLGSSLNDLQPLSDQIFTSPTSSRRH